jgi:hypothetical protein
MNRNHKMTLVLALFGLLAILTLTNPALAMNDPVTGRWITRDPLEYNMRLLKPRARDGTAAVARDSLVPSPNDRGFEPAAELLAVNTASVRHQDSVGMYTLAASNFVRRFDPSGLRDCSDCWSTCAKNQNLFGANTAGLVLCRPDGCRCACINESRLPPVDPNDDPVGHAKRMCTIAHEEYHVRDARTCCPCVIFGVGKARPCWWLGPQAQVDGECEATAAEVLCLRTASWADCGNDLSCTVAIQKFIDRTIQENCTRYGGNFCNYFPCPPY